MPSADFLALNPGYNAADMPGANKYGNERVTIDGYTFDSQAEGTRYAALRLMEKAGAIEGLSVHPVYLLQAAFRDSTGARHRAITYEADFSYTEGGRAICEDVKGHRTEVFRLKEKLFRFRYPDIELKVIDI
jgi:hypothetical protein